MPVSISLIKKIKGRSIIIIIGSGGLSLGAAKAIITAVAAAASAPFSSTSI